MPLLFLKLDLQSESEISVKLQWLKKSKQSSDNADSTLEHIGYNGLDGTTLLPKIMQFFMVQYKISNVVISSKFDG